MLWLLVGTIAAHAAPITIFGSSDTHGLRHATAIALNAEHGTGYARARTLRSRNDGGSAWWETDTAIAVFQQPLSRAELAAYEIDRGHPPLGIPIAHNALLVVVNAGNPLAGEPIALPILRRLAGKAPFGEQRLRFWGDLGATGAWRRRPVDLVTSDDDGVVAQFRRQVLDGAQLDNFVTHQNGPPRSLVNAVSRRETALGIVRFHRPLRAVAALPLRSGPDADAVLPTLANIRDGSYPLSDCVRAYVDAAPGEPLAPAVADALALLLDSAGQRFVEDHGFTALDAHTAARSRAWLSEGGSGPAPPCR